MVLDKRPMPGRVMTKRLTHKTPTAAAETTEVRLMARRRIQLSRKIRPKNTTEQTIGPRQPVAMILSQNRAIIHSRTSWGRR